MPIVKVGMLRGKSVQYKKTVLDCIHKGLVDSLRIEDWDRFQQVIEYDRDVFEYPSFKSDNFMIIELTLFPGRTKEQKDNIRLYHKNGYKEFKQEMVSDELTFVFLEKTE